MWTTKIKFLLVAETLWSVWIALPLLGLPLMLLGWISPVLWVASILTVPAMLALSKSGLSRNPETPNKRIRHLPSWMDWAETPDYELPGDFAEPTVKKLHDTIAKLSKPLAWFITSWYWIGFRNVGHGITWNSGHPTPSFPQHLTAEELEQYGTEVKQKRIGFLWLMWGFKTVNDRLNTQSSIPDDWYWAVPWYSIRFRKRDLGGDQ
ncbi:DUF7338 family protein [Gilvimarinus chinensis]|uniref:DUF7338 family protein n=1 Tax=Gilvimarinus chinensis TaxID=396005 RepID=UPI000362AE8C|nr:hypothetical protein [Gilvimarinus chinensis]